jgi:hypothetical protein
MSNKSTYEIVGDVAYYLSQHSGNSLIEYTSAARAMPITTLDRRAQQLPYIDSVLNNIVNIYAGYYLQAWQMSVNVGSVDILRTLDKLSPNRDPLAGIKGGRLGGFRLQQDMVALPFGNESPYGTKPKALSMQSSAGDLLDENDGKSPISSQIDRDFLKSHNEVSNLSVGKILSITVESEGSKATVPVLINLQVSVTTPSILAHNLTLGQAKDKAFNSRLKEWRAGMIEGINDLLFCDDLIADYRKNLHNDKDGSFRQTNKAANKNVISAILSGTPSVGTASAIYVMTAETAADVESKLRKPLSDTVTREKLFDETKSMLFVIIDDAYGQVTIYHRSIARPTTVSVKEMQRKGKSGGPDILDVLQQYTERKTPII